GAPGVAAGRYPSPTGMGITRASRDSGSGLSFPGSCAMMVVSFLQGKRAARVVSWPPALRFRSALHHGLVQVAVVDLSPDAFAAELAGDFLSDRDAPVTAAPAGDVDAGEHRLYLQGVNRDERADPVHVEGDNSVCSRRRQDVVTDHRVKPRPVAHVGVG